MLFSKIGHINIFNVKHFESGRVMCKVMYMLLTYTTQYLCTTVNVPESVLYGC